MKCTKVERLLPALIAGELDPATGIALERHLAGCTACAALRAGLDADRALLRELPLPEPGPGLATRIMAEIRVADGQASKAKGWKPAFSFLRSLFPPYRAGSRPSLGVAAAIMVFLVAAGVWAGASLGTDLAQRFADPGTDPLAVNDTPVLTEYVEVTSGSGR